MTRSTETTWITVNLVKEFYLSSLHISIKVCSYIQIHNNNLKNTRRMFFIHPDDVYNISFKISSKEHISIFTFLFLYS